VTDPAAILAGRREAALLALPSVHRMAATLAARCRGPSWVRALVPALDRFRALGRHTDLEALVAAARTDPDVAGRALAALAVALDGHPDAAVAGLAMGPKVWFRLNGVPVPWRPLTAGDPTGPPAAGDPRERLVLLALIGSGLRLAELLRVRLGDLGSLDVNGRVLPDPEAEPMAVAFEQRQGRVADRVTFLSPPARQAVLDELARRRRAGLDAGPGAPLVAAPDGRPATAATAAARRRSSALIRAGSRLNVELCRTTGEFFRTWGLPGSRFVPTSQPGSTRATREATEP
jgi:integrase